ncbi:MAG: AraC family transcriptional regulator [Micromonosporaceae bacterium]
MAVDYEAMVRDTMAEIAGRLDDPPGFRELADRVFLSPYHFHRIFRAMTGESPAEIIRRLRLERAAWQVRTTERPITELAFSSGYATHEAFTKAFQQAFGMPPSTFRNGPRDCPGIQAPNGLHFHPDGLTLFHLVDRGGDPMKLDVVAVPAKRLAAVRHKGPYYLIGAAFGALAQQAGPLGLLSEPDATRLAIYYDDPETKPAEELQSIAAVTVREDAEIGDLEEERQPSGRFLRAEFVGHYSGLGEAWSRLYGEHIPAGGYALRDGVCFEVYVSDHDTTPPDELRTDLYVPIG